MRLCIHIQVRLQLSSCVCRVTTLVNHARAARGVGKCNGASTLGLWILNINQYASRHKHQTSKFPLPALHAIGRPFTPLDSWPGWFARERRTARPWPAILDPRVHTTALAGSFGSDSSTLHCWRDGARHRSVVSQQTQASGPVASPPREIWWRVGRLCPEAEQCPLMTCTRGSVDSTYSFTWAAQCLTLCCS